jgi:hypothetical protein
MVFLGGGPGLLALSPNSRWNLAAGNLEPQASWPAISRIWLRPSNTWYNRAPVSSIDDADWRNARPRARASRSQSCSSQMGPPPPPPTHPLLSWAMKCPRKVDVNGPAKRKQGHTQRAARRHCRRWMYNRPPAYCWAWPCWAWCWLKGDWARCLRKRESAAAQSAECTRTQEEGEPSASRIEAERSPAERRRVTTSIPFRAAGTGRW